MVVNMNAGDAAYEGIIYNNSLWSGTVSVILEQYHIPDTSKA